MLGEIQEFGTFGREAQRYICRSLEVALVPGLDPMEWARSPRELEQIRAQMHVYRLLSALRASIPADESFVAAEDFLFPLSALTAFDLSSGYLTSFSEYRFLYERLLGAAVRPWLPSAFAAAAALPHFGPDERGTLFSSIGSALTDQWSPLEPTFYPRWLDECEAITA